MIESKQPTNTLTGVSFEVEPGEVVAIVGGTAAGKSTLCSLIAGLIEPVERHDADRWSSGLGVAG